MKRFPSLRVHKANVIAMGLGAVVACFVPPYSIGSSFGLLLADGSWVINGTLWSAMCQLLGGLMIGNVVALLYRNTRPESPPRSWRLVWASLVLGVVVGVLAWQYFHAAFPELNTNRYDGDEGWILYEEDSQVYWGSNVGRIVAAAALPVTLALWARLRGLIHAYPMHSRFGTFPDALLAWTCTVSVLAVFTIPRNLTSTDGLDGWPPDWWIGNLPPNGNAVTSAWWWIAPPAWLAAIALGAYLLHRAHPTAVTPSDLSSDVPG
ncbi:MAG: hypothetical protein V9E81_06665 [Marmoricola sp.]